MKNQLCPYVRCLRMESKKEAIKEIAEIENNSSEAGLRASSFFHYYLRIDGLTRPQADIIYKETRSAGGEAILARDVVTGNTLLTHLIISVTEKQVRDIVKKLEFHPSGLSELSEKINSALSHLDGEGLLWKGRGHSWNLGKRTLIMGILNVTPDSFSDGGLYLDARKAVDRGLQMEEEGADIIDIGGESTRPGSKPVPVEEEIKRTLHVIRALSKRLKVPISIDTTKAEVARCAIEEGAVIVNDISALGFDPMMPDIIARYQPLVILMHIRGRPETMQKDTFYHDLLLEIYRYLIDRINYAIERGVKWESIAIDPGIGFGKSREDNLRILKNLRHFRTIGRPIVLGTSRKSFIGQTLNLNIDERIEGTAATVATAIWEGAHILRVHDVKEMKRVAKMVDAIRTA